MLCSLLFRCFLVVYVLFCYIVLSMFEFIRLIIIIIIIIIITITIIIIIIISSSSIV